jgi:hypothetical protein
VSLRDLNDSGMLLPKEEWGSHGTHTTANPAAMVAALLLGALSIALIYFGAGGTVTLIGICLFLGFMGWITWISIKAVERQAARFAEEAAQDAPPGDTPAAE